MSPRRLRLSTKVGAASHGVSVPVGQAVRVVSCWTRHGLGVVCIHVADLFKEVTREGSV